MSEPLLKVSGLVVEYAGAAGPFRALDGVSIHAERGETVAVVGESGCGKTTLARCILGLQRWVEGSIEVRDGRNKAVLAERIGMVWQDPFASLDPRWTVERIIREPFDLAGRKGSVEEVLDMVGLSQDMARRHPHMLSGGQRQRVAIGRALALHPPLLICDEPTAALDLSIQAQILNLLKDLQKQNQCTVLYISHDLGTVRYISDRAIVMNKGRVVEEGKTAEVFAHPREEYTKRLLNSALTLDVLGRIPEG